MSRSQIGILIVAGLVGAGLLVFAGLSRTRPASQPANDGSGNARERGEVSPRRGLPQGLPLRSNPGPKAVSVSGIVVNDRGEGVEGADVQGVMFDGTPFLGGKTLSGEGGTFELELRPGKYSLYSRREGAGSGVLEPLDVRGEVLSVRLVLHPDIEIPFHIVDAQSGRAIPGIEISIERLSAGPGGANYFVEMGKWTSREKSAVSVVGLARGKYQVIFSGRGYEGRSEFFQVDDGKCSRSLPWRVKLRAKTWRAVFFVVDEKGDPLPQVRVEIPGRSPSWSGSRGKVTLDRLDEGSYQPLFSREGFLSARLDFQLEGGKCSLELPYTVKMKKPDDAPERK